MIMRKLVLALAGGAVLMAAPTKVGFVYLTPVGDTGWTYEHDQGRKEMEAAFKGQVVTQVVDNVPENADAERVIRQLAKDGCKVIFTTSFGYMNQTLKVAASFPDVDFLHCTGYKTARNAGIYNARFYEARYLCGVVAGKMTRTHMAGFVGAFPIPEAMQAINAFTLGMRSVDPKAEVRVIWVNSWFDPGKEREAAMALMVQGADMITHHTDSPAVVQAVEEKHKERNVWSLSEYSDMSKYGPNSQLTGDVHVWGKYYTRAVKEAMAGRWPAPPNVWGGMKDGMIKLAPLNKAVPAEVKALVGRLEKDIISGKLHPFAGPVLAQDGTLKVAAGKFMTDEDMGSMNYFVKGVNSNLPKE
jgi:simple sugar transport system substrate-binding protein